MAKTVKSKDDLVQYTDRAINELVYPKYKLQKAYNYYNGIRDAEQFRYLEENFGIGNPTSIEFTPLIRKHVDALIGEYLETPILPKVTCKDSTTLSNIARDKHLKIVDEVFRYLQGHLNNTLLSFIEGRGTTDKAIEYQLNKIVQDIDKNYISEYEVAAQNLVEYIMQSRHTDMTEKLKNLFKDLLITGYAYYKVKPSFSGNNIEIEVLDPLNTFVDRNVQSVYIKNSYRAVVRKWMTKAQILNHYGEFLSKDDRKDIERMEESGFDTGSYYVRNFTDQATGFPMTDGLEAGKEVVPGFPSDEYRISEYRLIPVYEVEWVEADKEGDKYIMNRYETIRIGNELYIYNDDGKSKNVVRSADAPTFCTLSTSGLYFSTRSSEPYSLVLACSHLQDKYDILHFYRDSLIANSGTQGDWVDISMLPVELGVNFTERLQKFLAYKKAGSAIINTSQEGRVYNNNTSFAGYDDTLKSDAIEGIEIAIERTENECSSISGVFRERLNGISERDAVSNVKVGISNSFTVTKQFFQQMDLLVNEILIDSLNVAKIVYKKGKTGALILGDKGVKIFTALPEYFTVTDFDIHIASSTSVLQDMELIKAIIPEFIKAGNIDPATLIEALTARSLTELKANVNASLQRQKDENNMVQNLQQQVEQMTQQLQETQQQLQQAQQKVETLNEQKIQLEQEALNAKNQVDWYNAHTERNYKEGMVEVNQGKVAVEIGQLNDGDARNDKVKF